MRKGRGFLLLRGGPSRAALVADAMDFARLVSGTLVPLSSFGKERVMANRFERESVAAAGASSCADRVEFGLGASIPIGRSHDIGIDDPCAVADETRFTNDAAMKIATVSPEAGELVEEGPVGSRDAARNSDYGRLDIGLPVEIARYKEQGDLKAARAACREMLEGDIEPELAACLRIEFHRMGRLGCQYRIDRGRALEMIRSEWPEFSDEQLDELIDRKRIDWRFIDGEQRFLNNFLDSLRVYPAEVPGLLEEDAADIRTRDEMLAKMRADGGASYLVTARARIAVPGALPGEMVRAWLPVPARSPQQSQIELLSMSAGGVVAREDAPARTVFWESRSERAFEVTYRYRIDAPYIDAYAPAGVERVGAPDPCPDDLAELRPHIRFTPFLRALASRLVDGIERPVDRARAIYDYLTSHVDYRYQPDYAQLDDIADNCAKSLRGDCGVMALTFITLCRIAGIPARWQSGLYVACDYIGPHDWAMFYTEEYGWLWADVSFGSSARRSGDETRRRHHFGNLDPWRMVANSAYQAAFEPDFDEVRWDPYDNQLGEASVEGRGCDDVEMAREIELIELRAL